MRALVLNFFMAFVWVLLSGEFSRTNFVVGLILGYGLLAIFRTTLLRDTKYFNKFPKFVSFIIFFLWELVKSNIRVAYDVLTPSIKMEPAIVRIPLDLKSDLEITLLANLITLTPGTLSIDVSKDNKNLFVHAMFIEDDDGDEFRQSIKDGFERRIQELFH